MSAAQHTPPSFFLLCRLLPAAIGVLFLAACAGPVTLSQQGNTKEVQHEVEKQREFVLSQQLNDNLRLQRVALPLKIRNASLCKKDRAPLVGLSVWNRDTIPRGFRTAAEHEYKVTRRPSVVMVVPGGPAAAAGLKQGDVVLSVQGLTISPGPTAVKNFYNLLAAAEKAGRKPVTLIIRRHAKKRSVRLRPVIACDWPVIEEPSQSVNAFADGHTVHIDEGMLRFAQNNTELAIIIAHEFGHNLMGHIHKKEANTLTAGIIGAILETALDGVTHTSTNGTITRDAEAIGAGAHSVAFEQEADYVGLYLMARAGYHIDGVENFWRRLSTLDASMINHPSDHPTNAQRYLAMEKTVAEIHAKQQKHQPLIPNLKSGAHF